MNHHNEIVRFIWVELPRLNFQATSDRLDRLKDPKAFYAYESRCLTP